MSQLVVGQFIARNDGDELPHYEQGGDESPHYER
jgi:hypothetical protein